MKKLFGLFLFCLLLIPMHCYAAANLFSADGRLLLRFGGSQVKNADQTLFSYRGNLIFKGGSYENDSILYLVRSQNIFDKTTGYIYNPGMTRTLFTIRKGKFYQGVERYPQNLLLSFEEEDENRVNIYNSRDSLVAYMIVNDGSNIELITAFVAFVKLYPETLVGKKPIADTTASEQVVVIRPYWDTQFYYEWEWDGRYLKPRYGNRPEDEWEFDGKYLKPSWGVVSRDEWVWDGQYLQPYWRHIPELTFYWDGRTLHPFWDFNKDTEWVIEDGRARLKWDSDFRKEWVFDGEVPVPVIALIVLGLADR